MASVAESEKYALKLIHQLGKTKTEEVGKEMGFSAEYVAVLCRSLWKEGYIRGTAVTGYETTEKGEKYLMEMEKK